jgi:hypothetical protein
VAATCTELETACASTAGATVMPSTQSDIVVNDPLIATLRTTAVGASA